MNEFFQMFDQILPIYLFEKLAPYIVVAFIIGIVTGWLSCDPFEDEESN